MGWQLDHVKKLRAMKTSSQLRSFSTFESQVWVVLKQAGYDVKHDCKIAGRQTDFLVSIASRSTFPTNLNYLVECKDQQDNLGVDVVDEVENRVKAARRSGKCDPDIRGWIISTSDLTRDAKDYAVALGIAFTRYDDLLIRVIDFGDYHRSLVSEFEEYEKEGIYIRSVRGRTGEERLKDTEAERLPTLSTLVEEWLATEGDTKPILLLGEPGVGKTLFTKRLAADLVKREDWRINPVRISLDSSIFPEDEPEKLVSAYLKQSGIPSLGTSLRQFMRDVGLVLIIDGFDSFFISKEQDEARRFLHSLAELHRGKSRVIVACRTDFFDAFLAVPLIEDRFKILIVEPFDSEMVKSYLQRILFVEPDDDTEKSYLESVAQTKEYADQYWDLFRDYGLDTMVRVPLFLHLFACNAQLLPNLASPGERRARVFWKIVEYEISHATQYEELEESRVQELFKTVAYALWIKNCLSMSFDDLLEIISQDTSPPLSDSEIKALVRDIDKSTPVVKREGMNIIKFGHAMFRDILVAARIAEALRNGQLNDILLGADVGFLVSELLDGQPYIYGKPDEIPENMIFIPAGPFISGEGLETRIAHVKESFFISKYPVTNSEFKLFLEDSGYNADHLWSTTGLDVRNRNNWACLQYLNHEDFNSLDQPIVGVSAYEAEAYCRWLCSRTGNIFRLPSALEWEKAARGTDGRKYPWGIEGEYHRAVTKERGFRQTATVGNLSPEGDSYYGVAEMAGNVWEWVVADGKYSVRGGSFKEPLLEARCSLCKDMDPEYRSMDIGFRIIREIPA